MTDHNDTVPAPKRRSALRHLLWVVPLVVVGAAVALWVFFPSGNGDDDATAGTVTADLEEVVVTDLTEVTTFNGTLGFDEGDPISAGLSGTLTAAAGEGDVVSEGGILFVVDDQPVPLLYGDTTVWRDMGLLPELEQLVPRMAGTVTWLAEEGDLIEPGDVLMKIDDAPLIVLAGDLPAYRMMRRNTEGDDVLQLQAALHALGYDPDGDMAEDGDFGWWTEHYVEEWQEDVGAVDDGRVDLGEVMFASDPFTVDEWSVAIGDQVGGGSAGATYTTTEGTEGSDVLALETALGRLGFDADGAVTVDETFDAATEAAVKAWQQSIGADDDGVVGPGEVVFLPGAVRISERLADPGATVSPGVPVLATSSDVSVVTVDLPAADQSVLDEGDRVTIVLPDDTEVGGSVGFKAETATVTQGEATFEVVIGLDDLSAAAGLDQAPVDVDVVTDRADGVMAVPVTALLALAEGGYAVEVGQPDGTTRLVAVEPGMYADGLVEIASDGVQPGDRVVAP
jgi:peptidoglycan hydrolase-like protein with peptidoglycan-binding domain